MRFYKNLYVSESMTKKKEKVIAKLNKKKYPLNTYVIVLIEEGENQLEFYSTLMFRQGSVIDDDIFVVGLADGYDDALYLVEEIAKEVYEKTVVAFGQCLLQSSEYTVQCNHRLDFQ